MRTPKIYLETTMFNFPFANDSPTKTLEEYMNDPDIIHEPEAMREIHAIRLRIHDETKDMIPEKHTAYFHERALRGSRRR